MNLVNVLGIVAMVKTVISNHKHRKISLHSPEQQRMFFGIARVLNYDKDKVRQRAKKYFKVDCFNDIKPMQLSELINMMLDKIYGNEQTKNN